MSGEKTIFALSALDLCVLVKCFVFLIVSPWDKSFIIWTESWVLVELRELLLTVSLHQLTDFALPTVHIFSVLCDLWAELRDWQTACNRLLPCLLSLHCRSSGHIRGTAKTSFAVIWHDFVEIIVKLLVYVVWAETSMEVILLRDACVHQSVSHGISLADVLELDLASFFSMMDFVC